MKIIMMILAMSIIAGAAAPIGGFAIPDLASEKQAYRDWGWTWNAGAEPNYPPDSGYSVSDPAIRQKQFILDTRHLSAAVCVARVRLGDVSHERAVLIPVSQP
jgi:hypothetical protein